MSKPRVAIWAAVSTPRQAQVDKDSLPGQVRDGKAWAEQMDAEVVRVYEVPGHSRRYVFFPEAAADMDAYAQLLEDCQSQAFTALWCRERSRLGRTDALIAQVEEIVRQAGAEVYSAAMPHQVGTASEAGALYISAIERASAQTENIQRQRRYFGGMRTRTKHGLFSGIPPYGYKPVRNEVTGAIVRYEFDDAEIGAVAFATKQFLDGKGYHQIARALDEAGAWKPRKARRWSSSTVRNIMLNDTYAGVVVFGRRGGSQGENVVKSDPEDARFPILWDEQTYKLVVRERARRHRGGTSPASFMSGVATCDRCGERMIATRYRGEIWYRCKTSVTKGGCHHNGITLDKLIDALEEQVRVWAASPPEDLDDSPDAEREHLEGQVRDVEAAILDLKDQQTRVALEVGSGTITREAAREATTILENRVDVERRKLAEIETQLQVLPTAEERRAALSDMSDLPASLLRALNPGAVRRILLRAGVRVWVEERKVTRITIAW